jgi:hypothetical protein
VLEAAIPSPDPEATVAVQAAVIAELRAANAEQARLIEPPVKMAVVPDDGDGPAGLDRAREQLAHNLVRLRKLGADADGETGEPHPLRVIREVLARRPADEIILATAPHRTTRLLAMDLQHRAYRSFGLPVTVLGIARTDV